MFIHPKKIFILTIILLAILLIVISIFFINSSNYRIFPPLIESSPNIVIEVIDGDTIILASGETIRLLGIDTPERDY